MERGDQLSTEGRTRTFYRIVKSDPPTKRDFWSHKRLNLDYAPSSEEIADGVSMFDDVHAARMTAKRYPRTGHLIAEVRVSAIVGVIIQQTRRRHHYTVWGDADLLLSWVVRVFPV